jgi:hypothetical protein
MVRLIETAPPRSHRAPGPLSGILGRRASLVPKEQPVEFCNEFLAIEKGCFVALQSMDRVPI